MRVSVELDNGDHYSFQVESSGERRIIQGSNHDAHGGQREASENAAMNANNGDLRNVDIMLPSSRLMLEWFFALPDVVKITFTMASGYKHTAELARCADKDIYVLWQVTSPAFGYPVTTECSASRKDVDFQAIGMLERQRPPL